MSGFAFRRIADYAELYRSRQRTPLQVAERVLEATAKSEALNPPMRFFIAQYRDDVIAQARASAERHSVGQVIGPLDGVPVAVKDELDQTPYPTTVGTTFLGRAGARADAEVVARLRAAGAVLIGKTNMHEIGLGITGINPHYRSARNPYDPDHVTGGSSSGSAAAVGAGLCPIAVGADGGGSIRVPAGLCGVVGLKPTFGLVSEIGAAPICWSLAHVGPIAATVGDAAAMLEVVAGPDERDPNTVGQPALRLDRIGEGVRGLRVGWSKRWWSDADESVHGACREALDKLVAEGATLVELDIEHLEHVRLVQYVTIGVEMAASQYEHRREHKRDYGADTRMLLEMASQLPGVDYVRAQRLRTLIGQGFDAALTRVDVLATPMTATTAPLLPPDAEKAGQSDDDVLNKLTAFSFPANLTGLPAISLPVGYDPHGLPIALQLIGRAWQESTILRAALALEARVERRQPRVHYDLLS